jgi:hypothetical protein
MYKRCRSSECQFYRHKGQISGFRGVLIASVSLVHKAFRWGFCAALMGFTNTGDFKVLGVKKGPFLDLFYRHRSVKSIFKSPGRKHIGQFLISNRRLRKNWSKGGK